MPSCCRLKNNWEKITERIKTLKVKKRPTLQRVLFLSLWLLLIGGMATLLIAANRKKKDHVCEEILIGIKGSGEKFYIEKADVLHLVERAAGGSLINRPLETINLTSLEKALKGHSWIRTAELYIDGKDALHISVEEREPIARVFATNGHSFYIDSAAQPMALVEKLTARVPVITNFTEIKKMRKADSAFMNEVKAVAQFIYGNEFWNAQVGQIDITADRQFELIPVIGDHIIKLGSGENVEAKLNRLFVFYKQIMSKVGFHKYAALDLRFDEQVVAIRREPASPVDSIQLQKNIEQLMNRAMLQEIEENMLPQLTIVPDSNFRRIEPMSAPVTTPAPVKNDISTTATPKPATVSKPAPKKAPVVKPKTAAPKKATVQPKPAAGNKPKAVMKRA